jgi:membrane-associated phospholipid phosphatase
MLLDCQPVPCAASSGFTMHSSQGLQDPATPGPPPDRFFAWPGSALLRHALFLAAAQTLWWVLVFHGADWLTYQHGYRVRLHLDPELQIPFVPVMVIAYLSMNLLFVMAPFILRSKPELQALTATLAGATFVAGIGFLLFPSEPAYPGWPHSGEAGVLNPLLTIATRVALRHNMAPSLHVGLSAVCVLAFVSRAGATGKALLAVWMTVIAASTLLIHQHHIVDVLTGLAVAWAGKRWIYDCWLGASNLWSPPDERHG